MPLMELSEAKVGKVVPLVVSKGTLISTSDPEGPEGHR